MTLNNVERDTGVQWTLLREFWKKVGVPEWHFAYFRKQLACGHAIISLEGGIGPDSDRVTKWAKHQAFSLAMSKLRAKVHGDDCRLVTGFFHQGDAVELSLLEQDEDPVASRLVFTETDGSGRPIVIGFGCADLAVECILSVSRLREEYPEFDPDRDFDFGWNDEMGRHISFWDGETRTFRRESMTGRHDYCIRAGFENYVGALTMYSLESACNVEVA